MYTPVQIKMYQRITNLNHFLRGTDDMKNNTNNAFVLIAHHNKHDGDTDPLLTKSIITGGKTLTNYAYNVIQIGIIHQWVDIRRGKITKMRDTYELLNEPIRLPLILILVSLKFGGVIANENCIVNQLKRNGNTKYW